MKIYNTYSSSLEEFKPIRPNEVSIYVCGPTVYNYIHIGNARPVVVFDVVRRYFEYLGYKVRFVSNFTDVDDKIIQKAQDLHRPELEVSRFYIESFLKDAETIGSYTDYIQPKVTEYMDHIVHYIEDLVRKGYAYVVDGDVYFRVSKVDEYGHLSNRNVDDLISGSRVEINDKKENPLDFTLWKKTETGIAWDSVFSKGRPGWHTECVAMIDDIFGGRIDIHGGGSDLIFPHHENEIAQCEATHNHNIANFWMHNGRLNMEGEKMSKSLGNVLFVKDLPVDPMAFRMFLLATHYRAPLNYSLDALSVYEGEYAKLNQALVALYRKLDLSNAFETKELTLPELMGMKERFLSSLEQDFNTPNGITEIQSLIKWTNTAIRGKADISSLQEALGLFELMLSIFGIRHQAKRMSEEDKGLYVRWEEARKNKDFALADELRQALQEKGLL